MADNPDTAKTTEGQVSFIVRDILHAPVIYFENAPALGYLNGVIRITLSGSLSLPTSDGKTATEEIVAAYLRCNIPAALSLRKALDDALLLAAPPPEGKGQAN
jgi:hypothetical protein